MPTIQIKDRTFNIFIDEHTLQKRIVEMSTAINNQLADKDPLFIAILNGAFMFASDLFKELTFPCQLSFIKVASYYGTQSTGNIDQLIGLKESIEGRNIVLIEDIIDTGITMKHLLTQLQTHKPASICIATLLLKKEALKEDIKPNYVGFEVPNQFLVAYGLDYDGYGRNLKHIYAEVE